MNVATYLFALFAYMAMLIGLSILVMIHGWGLEPKSWWWILGVGIGVQVILRALGNRITYEVKKNQ